MTRFLQRISLAVLLLFVAAWPAAAQTTLTSTTLAAALTANGRTLVLTSATGIAARDEIYVDGEAILIQALSSTTATVVRGREGTQAVSHPSGAVVWAMGGSTTTGAGRSYNTEVHGSCTATNELYLPHITLPSGNMYDCLDSEWVRYRQFGLREAFGGRSDGSTTYTVSGAITVKPGVVLLGCTGACAMTLANPTTEQNGMMMLIIASTAQAHTVTNTTGFDGGTTTRDLATYGGAVGDFMQLIAVNGVWYRVGIGVGAFGNVTIG